MNSVPNLNAIVNTSNGNYHAINATSNDCNSLNGANGDDSMLTTNRLAKLTSTNLLQNDLFQSNQELLNRLQGLTLGSTNNNNSFMYTNANASMNGSSPLPNSDYDGKIHQDSDQNKNHLRLYGYPKAQNQKKWTHSDFDGRNSLNLLTPSPSIGNFTPSPVFNRSPYSSSPLLDNSSSLNLNTSGSINHSSTPSTFGDGTCSIDESHKFIRPIATTPLNGTGLTIPEEEAKMRRSSTPISLISPEVCVCECVCDALKL